MLRNYKPKHRKAPWVLAQKEGLNTPPKPEKPSSKPPRGSVGPLNRQLSPKEQYRRDAKAFVREERKAGKVCPVVTAIPELRNGRRYGHPISAKITEVHHKAGRAGGLLLAKKYWLGVSRAGHRYIHSNPEIARNHGWLVERGLWNNTEKLLP